MENTFDKDKALEKFISENPKWKEAKNWELKKKLERQQKSFEKARQKMALIHKIIQLRGEQKLTLEKIGKQFNPPISKQAVSQLIRQYKI